MNTKYWIVYGEEGYQTTRFQQRPEATEHAKDMARQNPGIRFTVCEALYGYEIEEKPLRSISYGGNKRY